LKTSHGEHVFGLPDAAVITATVCWGLNFVITKSAAGTGPEQFRIFIYNIIRFSLSTALLFITMKVRGMNLSLERRYILPVAALSFVGIFVYQILYMVGQSLTSASNIGVMYSFMPLLVLLVSVVSGVERPRAFTVAGVLLGCFGLFLIIFEGGGLSIDVGSLFFLAAILCFAGYTVFGKPMLDRIPPIPLMAWILLFGTLYQLPLALWQLPRQSWAALRGIYVLYVFMAAVLSQYVGYTLFYYAVSRLGPSRTGVYSNLTPVFTLIFASFLRDEAIGARQLAGLAVIFTGIALTKVGR